MEYNYYKDVNLLVLAHDGKRSLYRLSEENVLEPQAWAQNQKRLEVYPKLNLVLTDGELYTLTGEVILLGLCKDEVIFTPMRHHILMQCQSVKATSLLWFKGHKIAEIIFCKRLVCCNEDYSVVEMEKDNLEDSSCWQVYSDEGKKVFKCPFRGDTVRLCGYFLIIDNLTQHGIYHLPSQKFLLEDQQRIVASSEIDFMMGCNITGELRCWFQDKWTQHSKVENFDILVDVEGKNGIYYLKQNGKYFLYTFDGKPFANLQIPHGADFVGYDADNQSIMLVNEGKACFL